MATYLDGIAAFHRRRASLDTRDIVELEALARASAVRDPLRPFAEALATASAAGGIGLVAEIKRRSPSRGALRPDLDPARLAGAYEAGGAACLSVLTDGEHFSGSPADLHLARQAVSLAVLRKDFTVSAADVYDARLMGADAVLLVVAILAQPELVAFLEAAGAAGTAALVEVHDREEVERALDAGASLIGVNQRDLTTFEVDRDLALRLREAIPSGLVAVAESGISSPADVARLRDAGYDGVLVGEALVVSDDPEHAARSLVGGEPGVALTA